VPDSRIARRFYISGLVQGVGYRYFARGAAQQLEVSGYARNLSDGRVEVYAIGTAAALAAFRAQLARGPRFASVSGVDEAESEIESLFEDRFTIERDDW